MLKLLLVLTFHRATEKSISHVRLYYKIYVVQLIYTILLPEVTGKVKDLHRRSFRSVWTHRKEGRFTFCAPTSKGESLYTDPDSPGFPVPVTKTEVFGDLHDPPTPADFLFWETPVPG